MATVPPYQQVQQQQQPVTDMERLRVALSLKSIAQRCEQTLIVLSSASSKDEFPSMVSATIDAIFGTYTGGVNSWELRTFSRAAASASALSSQDFSCMSTFLSANGPFLEMIYRLTIDSNIAFSFPIGFLPAPARKKIQAGEIPAFYRNKIKLPPSSGQAGSMPTMSPPTTPSITHLSLNAFEYFVFHLAFYLVNPSQARMLQQQQQLPTDTIFAVVFEQYLRVFLPATTTVSLPSLSTYASTRTWNSSSSSLSTARTSSSATSPFKSVLLKQSLCTSPSSNATTFSGVSTEGDGGLFRASWRSETFLSVLAEIWLNQNEMEASPTSSLVSNQVTLPTHELVRFVRQTIKQVHYFANMSRQKNLSPPPFATQELGAQVDSSMDEFRQAAIPIFIQKQVYGFFRFGFEKWPLDQGFRMMLETWLSYIQPWRYVDPAVAEREEERVDEVDEEWLTSGFLDENLLHFVVPFQDFLKRLFRMDLSSPKNAQMLYRVCKVFNQPRLKENLYRVEQTLNPSLFSSPHPLPPQRGAVQDSFFDGASFLSPSNGFGPGSNPATIGFAAQIAQMERADFVYRPIFGSDVRGSVEQLLQVIVQALGTAKSLLPPAPPTKPVDEDANILVKCVAAVFGFFTTNGDRTLADDMTLADINRMDFHLRQSLQHLVDLFDIEAPSNSSGSSASSSQEAAGVSSLDDRTLHPTNGAIPQTLGPNSPDNVNGTLTDLGRWQLANGLRRFDSSTAKSGFSGDPDLHPILSVEIPFLVRLLYRLSSALNGKYGRAMEGAYGRTDIVGRVVRQFLLAPCYGLQMEEDDLNEDPSLSPYSKQKRQQLRDQRRQRQYVSVHSSRPRLSLRFLANKQTLGYILGSLLFSPALGVGRMTFLLCLPIFAFFIGVVMALVKPKTC